MSLGAHLWSQKMSTSNGTGKRLFIIIFVFISLAAIAKIVGGWIGHSEENVTAKNTILHLDLKGVIMSGQKFIKNLKKYKEEDKIKAIVININSPGGAVGPSQEIYSEIARVKELKKPVVCVTTGVMASGAYYSAVACDKIVVAPGAMIGSIGVIMEFANLEKLYDWAKISRYTITSGKFKDSGAEFRAMRDDEKQLFQEMITEVYQQFRKAVMDGRQLKDDVMDNYADGRVFTGAKAVELGFADQIGTYEDAVQLAAKLANLGEDYEVFEIPRKKMSIFDLTAGEDEDEIGSLARFFGANANKSSIEFVQDALKIEYLNQPMYLMPGYWK